MGNAPRKTLENYEKKQLLFLWREYEFLSGKSKGFLAKADRGSSMKKAGKFRKQQLVFRKGIICLWTEKKKGHLTKTDGGLENAKNAICVYELEYVFIRGKVRRFLTTTDRGYPTTKAGQSRKKPLVFMKGNVCTWRGKVRVLDSNWWGVSDEKGWKSTKTATCVYEGKYVFMNGGRKSFWLKLMGDALRQRLENYEKSNLCLWRGICVFERKKQGYFE